MTARRTYCRICEAACGLVAETDARGEVVALRPDRDHPVSRGYVCAKGTRFLEVARHPDRLVAPQRREASGRRVPVSWSEALSFAGQQLGRIRDAHGPHAVGVYVGNPMAFTALGSVALGVFLDRLGTRNVFSAGSQDCNNKFAGSDLLHGSPVIHPVPDLAHTDLAVFFGTNPAVSQGSFVHLEGGAFALDDLEKRGGRIVWVDPRRTESARRWGEHVAIRPGTDVYLMLALLALVGDGAPDDPRVEGYARLSALAATFSPDRAAALTGIPAERIHDLARRLREAPSAALHMSVGVNQGPFGTLCYVLLHALAFATGNLDRKGGLVFHPVGVAGARLLRGFLRRKDQRSRIGGHAATMATLPGAILADEILTPGADQIRALVVLAGDPLTSIPGGSRLREALSALDFLCTIDLFENATGRLAHVLLPAASWLERWDFATTSAALQTAPLLQVAGPVMPPVGEARTDARILAGLLDAMGLSTVTSRLLGRALDGLLPSPRHGLPAPAPRPGRYLGRGPLTPGRRLRLWHSALEGEPARLEAHAAALAPGGFVLIGRRRKLGHNSWLHGGTREGDPEEQAWLSPEDLRALGLSGGGRVRIRTGAATLSLSATAHASVAPGVVCVPHGLPGVNVNALIPSGPDAVEPLSGQHLMTGIPAEVVADRG